MGGTMFVMHALYCWPFRQSLFTLACSIEIYDIFESGAAYSKMAPAIQAVSREDKALLWT
jgi:hypothetical protein